MIRATPTARAAFTITELLVVIGAIVLLVAVLFPALSAVRGSSIMTASSNNMRQIATFMQVYQKDNREIIIPSQFDYTNAAVFTAPGKVRSEPVTQGDMHKGTWTDIIWTYFDELGNAVGGGIPAALGGNYRYDSPDGPLYALDETDIKSPLRSVGINTREVTASGNGIPFPFGGGAKEIGLPGFFAANDFFSAVPDPTDPEVPVIGEWYSSGEIAAPDRSIYLVDSYAGEVISDVNLAAWDNNAPVGGGPPTIEVDFRYPDACLMLFLDGHVAPQNRWVNLADLQDQRRLLVQDLDQR